MAKQRCLNENNITIISGDGGYDLRTQINLMIEDKLKDKIIDEIIDEKLKKAIDFYINKLKR